MIGVFLPAIVHAARFEVVSGEPVSEETRVAITKWVFLELYWGHRFKRVDTFGEPDPQDDGIHFRIRLNAP